MWKMLAILHFRFIAYNPCRSLQILTVPMFLRPLWLSNHGRLPSLKIYIYSKEGLQKFCRWNCSTLLFAECRGPELRHVSSSIMHEVIISFDFCSFSFGRICEIGAVACEVQEWIKCAERADLPTLARIEANVVNKFPGFTGFEEFGYGSFLKFLTKHKELMEAIEEVGGMAQSGREGARIGCQGTLNSVLDFISQCGNQTSTVSFAS